jgi:long-subunit fatty acid transport protein
MVSPVDQVNLAAVYKTPFAAGVSLEKSRRDSWGTIEAIEEVTTNAASSDAVRLDFPRSFGFGVSWRPRDTLTISADFTRTSWSEARILDYFDVAATGPSDDDGVPAPKPPPRVYPELQYPTLRTVPDPSDPDDPARLLGQQDAEQVRLGVEWVLIHGRLKVPFRAGYFSDRQITPVAVGDTPRFDGFTVGTGLILGSMLLDVAYVHEYGAYSVASAPVGNGELDVPPTSTPSAIRNTVTTNRFFASIIYRFSRGWPP